ncbi:MAG: DUF4249 domain-containing protein [Bacteroides sp.]|nr:DUF4249 domain-containing protein [Bacteroides sp.]
MLLFLLVACTEAIDFGPSTPREVVVNCVLSPDSKQYLTLSYSNKLNEFQYESIADAVITLYCGVEIVGNFKKDKYNEWYLDYTPAPGKEYWLTVEIPDYPIITAATTVPLPLSVNQYENEAETNVYIRKHFVQQAYGMPYWAFIINKYDQQSSGVTHKDKLVSSLGTNYRGCDGFNASGSPMSASFSSQYVTLEHYAYLRMVSEDAQKSDTFYIESPSASGWHFFRAASPEYDKYLKTSIQKMMVYQSFDDPSQWFDETMIYSNIENGLGIFGAYIDTILTP